MHEHAPHGKINDGLEAWGFYQKAVTATTTHLHSSRSNDYGPCGRAPYTVFLTASSSADILIRSSMKGHTQNEISSKPPPELSGYICVWSVIHS